MEKLADESVTDYMLWAKTAAGETFSDSLLIAMIIKELPFTEYKPISTVVIQKDKELCNVTFESKVESPKPNIHDEVIVNLLPCSSDRPPTTK